MKYSRICCSGVSVLPRRMLLYAGCLFFAYSAFGQFIDPDGVGPFRTQTIELKDGWNAVYLELEPLESDPTALFVDTPIEMAAGYFRPGTTMEFIDDPADPFGDRTAWSFWFAPEREDALLTDLYSIQAHRAYLLFSREDYTWKLEGTAFFDSVSWHPNAHSLVGFPVDAANAPTVANFFKGAKAHEPLKIYTMVGGRWVLLNEPDTVLMERGRAYWVESQGASDFSGPFRVEFAGSSSGGLIYSERSGAKRIVIENVAAYPQRFSISVEAGTAEMVPTAYLLRALNASDNAIERIPVPFPPVLEIAAVEPGESFGLDLEVLQEQVAVPVLGSSLVVSSDAGLRVEIPILSIRRDLAGH